jgi:hypothetical protein
MPNILVFVTEILILYHSLTVVQNSHISFMCVCCQKVIVFKIEFEICRIITQPRLPWWPQIDLVYNKSSDLRLMFTETLNKALQGCITHTTLRMIPVN